MHPPFLDPWRSEVPPRARGPRRIPRELDQLQSADAAPEVGAGIGDVLDESSNVNMSPAAKATEPLAAHVDAENAEVFTVQLSTETPFFLAATVMPTPFVPLVNRARKIDRVHDAGIGKDTSDSVARVPSPYGATYRGVARPPNSAIAQPYV